jgi:glucosamine kinase
MTAYVAGIDGGQSSTTAVIGDQDGRVVGRGRAGAADEIGVGADSTRLVDALRDALGDARMHAGLPDDVQFAAIVAGISGFEGRVYGRAPELPSEHLALVHDALPAHCGALAGKPGIVVIAGTGSAVFATGGSQERTAGGWGYLFGDEGSAFWVAREALTELMRRYDQGERESEELRAAYDFFGVPGLHGIARAFYAAEISRRQLAAFAPLVMRFRLGRDIAHRGADRLAGLVRAALEAGAAPEIAFVGGMFCDERFADRVAAGIAESFPAARILPAKYEPSVGALMLAYRAAGLGPFAEIRGIR